MSDETNQSERSITPISHRATNHRYMTVKPRRLANYLSVRRLLIDSENKLALKAIRKADNQMLGETSE